MRFSLLSSGQAGNKAASLTGLWTVINLQECAIHRCIGEPPLQLQSGPPPRGEGGGSIVFNGFFFARCFFLFECKFLEVN